MYISTCTTDKRGIPSIYRSSILGTYVGSARLKVTACMQLNGAYIYTVICLIVRNRERHLAHAGVKPQLHIYSRSSSYVCEQ